ncbi:pinin [Anabrus simplex]|uniref:pinin n=1 Tax=Anabrus simplex TaxID=316456 RepID=UPI0035A37B79
MTTEIMKSFGALQAELEKAKDNLKGVDEHIKKLIGRDPSDVQLRPGMKRPANNQPEEFRGRGEDFRGRGEDFRGRGRGFTLMRGRLRPEEDESLAAKKRPGDPRAVFSRLSGPPRSKRAESPEEEELPNKPAISSRVIATPKELPSRQEAMAAQSTDEKSKARNRRMFGALLGTLQKFRQEETRMKDREEKRAKVEKKLEENAKREKEELKRERQELFQERKRKQAEIKKIELKMLRIKEQDEWESKHRHLLNFIQTRAKPHIFYLPKIHNMKTEERLVASQKIVAKMIEKKRQEVRMELEAIEKRGRWRQGLGEPEGGLGREASDDEHHMEVEEDLGDKENQFDGVGDEMLVGDDEAGKVGDVDLAGIEVPPTPAEEEVRRKGGKEGRGEKGKDSSSEDDEEEEDGWVEAPPPAAIVQRSEPTPAKEKEKKKDEEAEEGEVSTPEHSVEQPPTEEAPK